MFLAACTSGGQGEAASTTIGESETKRKKLIRVARSFLI